MKPRKVHLHKKGADGDRPPLGRCRGLRACRRGVSLPRKGKERFFYIISHRPQKSNRLCERIENRGKMRGRGG
ncbi:hypothetical protein HMPREF0262_03703 [Clostridium sp. ATCC 29733]|nr:hypothetical protein HMPREF0262_03703 [Clostridium sp. ATCC 29733]